MPEERLRLEEAHAALDEPEGERVPEGVAIGPRIALDQVCSVAPGPVDRVADRLCRAAPRRILAALPVTAEMAMRCGQNRVVLWKFRVGGDCLAVVNPIASSSRSDNSAAQPVRCGPDTP